MKFALLLLSVLATAGAAEASAAGEAEPHGRALVRHTIGAGPGTGSTYGQRNSNSLLGMVVGFALLGLAPLLLWGTEMQGVRFGRLLKRARQSSLANVPSASIDGALEGQMVHTLGPLSVGPDDFSDRDTGVVFGAGASSSAQVAPSEFSFPLRATYDQRSPPSRVASTPLRIRRTVEVYGWTEREEQDANETRYTYETGWVSHAPDSAQFKYPRGHTNPPRAVQLESDLMQRDSVSLGAFALPKEALVKADWWSDCAVADGAKLSAALATKGATVVAGAICVPGPPPPATEPDQAALAAAMAGEERVGAMRVSYKTVEVPGANATAVGVQVASGLRPFTPADAARVLGRAPKPSEAALDIESCLREDEAKIAALKTAMANGSLGCCQVFSTLSSVAGKLMTLVMKHAVGTDVMLLSPVGLAIPAMFRSEEVRLEKALSGFRLGGTVLFVLGFYLVLGPFAAIFSFVPFLARMISSLFLVAAVLLGVTCSMITIAVAWVVARPVRGAFAFALLDGLYALLVVYDGAGLGPAYVFTAAAVVGAVFGAIELWNDHNFSKAALSSTAARTRDFVQVGLALTGRATAPRPDLSAGVCPIVQVGIALPAKAQGSSSGDKGADKVPKAVAKPAGDKGKEKEML